MTQIKSWDEFKIIAAALSGRMIHFGVKDYLHVVFIHGGFSCFIALREGTSDYSDFDINYKHKSNVSAGDDDGDLLTRHKIAPRGWRYCAFGISLKTSEIGSLDVLKKNQNDSDINSTYKIYDINDVEITDNTNKLNAVRTSVTFEPMFNISVISGMINQTSQKVLLDVVVVPDVPENMGGSKYFAQNINLKIHNAIIVDGKAPKLLNYNSTYHTNKIKFDMFHAAGVNEEIQVILQAYRE